MPKVDLSSLPQEEIDRRVEAYAREFGSFTVAVVGILVAGAIFAPIAAIAAALAWAPASVFIFHKRHPGIHTHIKKLGRRGAHCMPIRTRLAVPAAIAATFLVLQIGVMAVLGRGPLPSSTFLIYGGFLAIGVGGILIHLGRFSRAPGPLSCAKCDYNLEGFEELPYVCPECGVGLGTTTSTTRTPRYRNPAMLWSGVAILALTLTASITLVTARGPLYGVTPTQVLMRLALTDRKALAELTTRTLTQDEIKAFADRVLGPPDKPRERDWSDTAALDQIAAWITRGDLDDTYKDRFFRDPIRLAIDAPTTGRIGQPIVLTLKGNRPQYGTAGQAMMFFRGFEPDGPTRFPGEPEGTLTPDFIDQRSDAFPGFYLNRFGPKEDVPAVSIVPLAPGPLTIRARIIVTVQPSFWPITVTWPADGSDPTLPPRTIWSEAFDIETTIDVRE